PPEDVTVIVNTADDLALHGLHISPDVDSVLYWLAGVADRERGWGRSGESFRTLEELERLGGESWFGLGDLDLATHLFRTQQLAGGRTLEEATASLSRTLGVTVRVIPMSNDRVETRISYAADGELVERSFQEYWVRAGGPDTVKSVRFDGVEAAAPPRAALEALASADAIVVCPSNPIVSIGPILAVPGLRDAVRREVTVGISPIVAGAPLRGMADRLMPALGYEVTALGAARVHVAVLGAWLIDEKDRSLARVIGSELGVNVGVADTVMSDDEDAERVARRALELLP
ncbi:MAG TPA: 2-phospho-L-lactate transferase, partial [Actinomycetota bacterium]|nr:2-phospho-L-lactate transferase [Actinomycetota bacterium]